MESDGGEKVSTNTDLLEITCLESLISFHAVNLYRYV